MASRGDEIIRLRNEGAVAYDEMIKQHGHEAARHMLISRVGTRCNIVMTADEYNASVTALQTAVVNTYLTLIYTTLHDVYGFGKKRLQDFKNHFDELTALCYTTDKQGRRYITVTDCANDMNRLYDMGINAEVVNDTESTSGPMQNRLANVDEIINILRKRGFQDAADSIWNEVYGPEKEITKARTKEQRAIAKQRRREDRKYIAPNMNIFDPEVSAGYLAVLSHVMTGLGMDPDAVVIACQDVNELLGEILDQGKARSDALVKELEEETGIVFE